MQYNYIVILLQLAIRARRKNCVFETFSCIDSFHRRSTMRVISKEKNNAVTTTVFNFAGSFCATAAIFSQTAKNEDCCALSCGRSP